MQSKVVGDDEQHVWESSTRRGQQLVSHDPGSPVGARLTVTYKGWWLPCESYCKGHFTERVPSRD